jgi:hypothetical protein
MGYLTSVSLIVLCPRFFKIYMGTFSFMYAKKIHKNIINSIMRIGISIF